MTYYSINFSPHKNLYDFYNAKKTVDDFVVALERVFNPRKKVRLQGLMELINYMPTEIIEPVSRRIWMTDVMSVNFLIVLLKVRLTTI